MSETSFTTKKSIRCKAPNTQENSRNSEGLLKQETYKDERKLNIRNNYRGFSRKTNSGGSSYQIIFTMRGIYNSPSNNVMQSIFSFFASLKLKYEKISQTF